MPTINPHPNGKDLRTHITQIVPRGGIFDLGLRELWAYKQLLFFFAWRDVKVRYKQTLIGGSWAVLQPFAGMILFTIFFGNLLELSTEGLPAPIFYYTALLPWTYLSIAIANASNSVVANQNLIHKIYFPRLLLPMSTAIPGLIDFAVAFGFLLILMVIFDVGISAGIVAMPLFMLLALMTVLALGIWLSILNARFRDVRFVVPFLVQMLFFASPIVYSADEIADRWLWVYSLNPVVGIIEGFRWSVTGNGEPPGLSIGLSVAIVLIVLFTGLVFFRKEEATLADVV
jgi:lipopolysaccharide transport system permease protein